MPPETEDLQRDLNTVLFQIRAESLNEEERSVEAVVSTENTVEVYNWIRGVVMQEVLLCKGCQLPTQVPLLDNHSLVSNDDLLGSVREFRNEGNQIAAKLVFAKDDEIAERRWNKVRQGHLTDVSVRYRPKPGGFVDIPVNRKAFVEGKEYDGGTRGLRVVTSWIIREVSLTPIGADQAAKIRAALGDASQDKNRKEFSEMPEKTTKKEEGVKTPEPDGKRSASETPPETPPEPVDVDKERKAAVKEYQDRRDAIRKAAEGTGVKSEIVEKLVDSEKTLDEARAELLDHLRNDRRPPVNGDFSIHSQADDVRAETLAAGLQLRCGLDVYNSKGTDEQKKRTERLAEEGTRFMDQTLLETCRNALQVEGVRVPHRRSEMIRAAVSTATLQSVLSNTVGGKLTTAFQEAPDTTVGLTTDTDLSDFKQVDRFSVGKTGSLSALPRGGKANHATIGDEKESYNIARYAEQFVVDEQDLIDDNLSALQRVPSEMGAAAARLRPDLVYAILMSNPNLQDGVAIFHADHGNLGSAVLAAAGLKTAVTAMMLQTKDDVQLNLSPHFLIVPPSLQFTARELINSQLIVLAGDADIERGNRNVLADMVWELRVEGRLESGVTDPVTRTTTAGSSTAWFLSVMANMAPTIEVGYLAGTGRRPTLRSWTLNQGGQYGVGFDIKLDIGAKALDFRGLYKSEGA